MGPPTFFIFTDSCLYSHGQLFYLRKKKLDLVKIVYLLQIFKTTRISESHFWDDIFLKLKASGVSRLYAKSFDGLNLSKHFSRHRVINSGC